MENVGGADRLVVDDATDGVGKHGSDRKLLHLAATGATLVVATEDGSVNKVVVPDDLDLTGLNLVVEQVGLPVVFNPKAFLETSGALSGSFATVTLPAKRTKNYSVDIGASAATLGYAKPGALLIVR